MGVECAPGLRERKKANTRRAIADVAAGLFLTRGFDDVTVAEIADAAGVSVKTIFNYFGSKEDLFFDLAPILRAAIVDAVTGRPAGQTPVGALTHLLTEHRIPDGRGWDALDDPAAVADIRRFHEVWRASPALRARLGRWDRELERALAEALAGEAGCPPDAPVVRAMAAMLVAALQLRQSAMADWVLHGRPADAIRRDVCELTVEAFGRVARAFPELDRPRAGAAIGVPGG